MEKQTKEEKEIERLEQWLECIYAISLDQDGCNSVDDLIQLVDEINEMANSGMCGEDSPLAEI